MSTTPLSYAVREYSSRLGYTQKKIAELSGYSEAYMSRIQNGLSSPNNPSVLDRLAHALQLSGNERAALINAARISQRCIQLPLDLDVRGYTIFYLLRDVVNNLGLEDLTQIESICRKFQQKEILMET